MNVRLEVDTTEEVRAVLGRVYELDLAPKGAEWLEFLELCQRTRTDISRIARIEERVSGWRLLLHPVGGGAPLCLSQHYDFKKLPEYRPPS